MVQISLSTAIFTTNGSYDLALIGSSNGNDVNFVSRESSPAPQLVLELTDTAVPPAAPSGLVASAVSSSQINLSWTDNATNETGFKIERKTGSGGAFASIATNAPNATSYSDTGLIANTEYYYRVRASNAGGDSAYSSEANATTLPTAPTAPSGLAASAISSSQINLSWTDKATNETGFKIERKTGSDGTYVEIATLAANATSYNDTDLDASTQYYYRVRATNTGGDSAYSTEANATTLPTAPAIPGDLAASAVSSNQINLSWTDDAADETGFKIERKIGSGGTYVQVAAPAANTTSYSDTGLSANTEYYYRVRACNAGGDSDYSSEANATTLPAAPLLGIVLQANGALLSWQGAGFGLQERPNLAVVWPLATGRTRRHWSTRTASTSPLWLPTSLSSCSTGSNNDFGRCLREGLPTCLRAICGHADQ